MKVGYINLDGHTSTAYLDDEAPVGERWYGTDKYTDKPVCVYWDDDDEVRAWCEVPSES